MKTALTLILALGLGFSSAISAQSATAVMQARVNVISGASITPSVSNQIEFSTESLVSQNFNAGSFYLTTTPGSDINVYVSRNLNLKSEDGKQIEINTIDITENSSSSGEHLYNFNGTLDAPKLSAGTYKGSITAVVEYL